MRAAIYCRVSTREQAESGYSIPDQLRNCRDKAIELGAMLIEEFLDNESGAFLDRPGLEKLRHLLRQKYIDLVITKSPDRLSRNITHQLILREEIIKSGAKLVFLTFEWQNTPDGRLLMNVQGVVSDYEREVIRERTMMGRRSKVLAGKIPLNSHVYGYAYDKKNCTYLINEEEAQVVRNIYNWLLYGDEKNEPMGGILIARKLADLKIKPPRRADTSWARATVYKILKNVSYTGTAYFYREKKRKIGPHKVETTKRPESEWLSVPIPSIIDQETFDAAQRKLWENSNNNRRNTKRPYLLHGLVFCALCGRRMSINPEQKRRNKIVAAYYMCPKNVTSERRFYVAEISNPKTKCHARTIPINCVEHKVWSFISSLTNCNEQTLYAEIEKIYKHTKPEQVDSKLILEELVQQEDTLLNKRKKITKWFREELISESEAEKELKEIKIQLLEFKERKAKLQSSLSAINKEKKGINDIAQHIKSVTNPETMSFEEKRTLLLKVLNGIHVLRTDNARGYGASAKIILEIHFDFKT